jgi:hypothetical protein
MATAKVKIFEGSETAVLETEINEWLSGLPPESSVQRSETAFSIGYDLKKEITVPLVVITVWYIEGVKF